MRVALLGQQRFARSAHIVACCHRLLRGNTARVALQGFAQVVPLVVGEGHHGQVRKLTVAMSVDHHLASSLL